MAALAERDVNVPPARPVDGKTMSSNKRKSGSKPEVELDSIEIPDGAPIPWNANQVRGKIRTYLGSGEMTVSQFQDTIDVSSKSYYTFMNQSGPQAGIATDTFMEAAAFFMKREKAGLGMPKNKKAKTDSNSARKGAASSSKQAVKEELDVSGIHLDGDDTDSVPIYDTCDDVRNKINAHLRNTADSQAGLINKLKAQFSSPPPPGLSASSLKTFLSMSGAQMGSSSPILYASYVYFEKLRIKQGKKKSKKREEMEKVWGGNGMKRRDMNGPMLCKKGEVVLMSIYGELKFRANGHPAPDSKWEVLVFSMKP